MIVIALFKHNRLLIDHPVGKQGMDEVFPFNKADRYSSNQEVSICFFMYRYWR